MNSVLELISRAENDSKWLDSNMEGIRKKYTNEFVAVKNSKIIASDKDMKTLIKRLEIMKEDPALLLIKFIPEEDVTYIL